MYFDISTSSMTAGSVTTGSPTLRQAQCIATGSLTASFVVTPYDIVILTFVPAISNPSTYAQDDREISFLIRSYSSFEISPPAYLLFKISIAVSEL